MTELRKRMIECLQLRGLSERTQEAYTSAVRQLAEHYHKSPDLLTEEELRQYFLFIKNVKHYSRNTMTIALCGIKFFYEQTLHRPWAIFGIVRPAPEKKLPVILSLAEVRQILGCLKLARYRVCLTTIYSCGLRLQEGTNLHLADIDSGRMMIHVRHGKGAQDRYVPLPERTLTLLRQYWATHRNSAAALSFTRPRQGALGFRNQTDTQEQRARRFPRGVARKWQQQTRFRAYAAPLLGYASAGSRRQPAAHPAVAGP